MKTLRKYMQSMGSYMKTAVWPWLKKQFRNLFKTTWKYTVKAGKRVYATPKKSLVFFGTLMVFPILAVLGIRFVFTRIRGSVSTLFPSDNSSSAQSSNTLSPGLVTTVIILILIIALGIAFRKHLVRYGKHGVNYVKSMSTKNLIWSSTIIVCAIILLIIFVPRFMHRTSKQDAPIATVSPVLVPNTSAATVTAAEPVKLVERPDIFQNLKWGFNNFRTHRKFGNEYAYYRGNAGFSLIPLPKDRDVSFAVIKSGSTDTAYVIRYFPDGTPNIDFSNDLGISDWYYIIPSRNVDSVLIQ